MKPGSSDRCKARMTKNAHVYRCHLRAGHDRDHQAPMGWLTLYWLNAQPSAVPA